MKDTIIKGSGNSRSIRFPPNTLTVYPDWPSFVASASSQYGAPCDIGPINPLGCQVVGDDLNKANLLTDATETLIWGSAANRTVNQALAQLRSLVSTAQSAANSANSNANGRLKYTSGTFSYANPSTITFGFSPKVFLFLTTNNIVGICFNPAPRGSDTSGYPVSVTWGSNSVTFSNNNLTTVGTCYYAAIG